MQHFEVSFGFDCFLFHNSYFPIRLGVFTDNSEISVSFNQKRVWVNIIVLKRKYETQITEKKTFTYSSPSSNITSFLSNTLLHCHCKSNPDLPIFEEWQNNAWRENDFWITNASVSASSIQKRSNTTSTQSVRAFTDTNETIYLTEIDDAIYLSYLTFFVLIIALIELTTLQLFLILRLSKILTKCVLRIFILNIVWCKIHHIRFLRF